MIWQVEVCRVCGMQLTPCPGSNKPTQSGRCRVQSHRERGGTIVTIELSDDYAVTLAHRVKWEDWRQKKPTLQIPSPRPTGGQDGE